MTTRMQPNTILAVQFDRTHRTGETKATAARVTAGREFKAPAKVSKRLGPVRPSDRLRMWRIAPEAMATIAGAR